MGFAGGTYFDAPGDSLSCVLQEDSGSAIPTASKVICTIGPQSNDVDTLCSLLEAGMAIARFDFSYGNKEFHQQGLDNLHKAMHKCCKLAAVMMDTVGPEIFVINRPEEPLQMESGAVVKLVCDPNQKSSSSVMAISHSVGFIEARVQPGTSIFIGQYLFTGVETTSAYLTVQQVGPDWVTCVCNNSCRLEGPQLVVHIGNMKNASPVLSLEDKDVMRTWAAPNKIDFLNVSFCRSAQDIAECRAELASVGLNATQVVAKIESREGLSNYREIVDAADAVVFSRGNLGICLEPEKVFLAQKMLLQACNLSGKPVFVTRVIDSMTEAPRPTRAEATDVANIVLDGADGIQLGAEVFRGKYVVDCMKTVNAICRQAEQCFDSAEFYKMVMENLGANTLLPNLSKLEALASSAVRAAAKVHAALILVFTVTGRTARMVAKYRPAQPILTVVVPALHSDGLCWDCKSDAVVRQSLISRGVNPICFDPAIGSFGDGAILKFALAYALGMGMVKNGDRVVVSQCPRVNVAHNMDESGVVKIMSVDTGRPALHRFNSGQDLAHTEA